MPSYHDWYADFSPPPPPPSPMAQETAPFNLAKIARNTSKCAGCGNKYCKPPVPPYDLCVQHREWWSFTSPGGGLPSKFSSAYYCSVLGGTGTIQSKALDRFTRIVIKAEVSAQGTSGIVWVCALNLCAYTPPNIWDIFLLLYTIACLFFVMSEASYIHTWSIISGFVDCYHVLYTAVYCHVLSQDWYYIIICELLHHNLWAIAS